MKRDVHTSYLIKANARFVPITYTCNKPAIAYVVTKKI